MYVKNKKKIKPEDLRAGMFVATSVLYVLGPLSVWN